MKRLILILFCAPIALFAQSGVDNFTGAHTMSMGNVGTTITNAEAAFANQAGLAYIEETEIMVGGQRRFAIAGLNNFIAGAAFPSKAGTFGLAMNYFGNSAYSEQKIGLGYGRKLFDKLAIGAQFDFINFQSELFGNEPNITFEIGLMAEVTKQFFVGAHVFSPIQVEIVEDEYIPSVIKGGFKYVASEYLNIVAEVEKDIQFPARFKAGIDYELADNLRVRAGIQTQPVLLTFGAGFDWQEKLLINFASTYHQDLGFTPSIGVSTSL